MTSLPSNPDAERALLSCALQWPESFDKIALHPSGSDLFYNPANREIWAAMQSVRREAGELDLVALISRLRASERLDAVGGAGAVTELLSDVPTPKMTATYLRAAEKETKRRRLATECHALAASACDQLTDIDQVIQAADTAIQSLLKTASVARSRQWGEILGRTVGMIEDARVAGGKIPGISTGFESLDASTNGYQGGQLWVLAARPGAGKTAMLMNLVENLVSANVPTAIYSAEMFAEELAIRSLSGQTRIDSLKLARGDIGKMDFIKLRDAINNSHKWPLWIDDRADMRLVDIQVSARQLVKQSGVRVIFVDYLQLIKEPEGSRNREDAVRRLSDGLKQLAKELDITVVTLAQLNRDAEKRGRPVKSDLRDSGAIEQDANVILLLNPTEPDSQDPVVDVEVIVAKCRGGKMGPISFEFDRPVTTFREKREY
jgi:replicative DNA helicase